MNDRTGRALVEERDTGRTEAARSLRYDAELREASEPNGLAEGGAGNLDHALAAIAERLSELSTEVERLRALLAPLSEASVPRRALDEHASYLVRRRGTTAVSKRERAVLAHLLDGLSNREISRELGISEKTVKNHLWKLYRKLGVRSRTQLFHSFLSAPVDSSRP